MGLLQDASRVVLALDILFLLLVGFSLLFVEPGSGSYVVAVLTMIPLVLTFVACVAIIYTGWVPFEEVS